MPAQTVIKVRRDTAANWISADPTLASGEIGFETDTNQLKIGNGSSAWTALDYTSGGASVEISETAPASPDEGNVWFNSTDGRAYIYYDSTWVDLNPGIAGPAGATGETGIAIQTTEPSSTDVLWLDTDEVADVPVPAGGTDGQVLTKTSSADYATAWENIPEGTTVISSATEPVDTGAIWYNTENGNAYIYYDGFWASISGLPSIPVGGTTGQVLAKSSNTDYATQWVAPSALTLVKSQAVGTAVSSVVVTDCFNSTYDNYKIIYADQTSSSGQLKIQLSGITTGYAYNDAYSVWNAGYTGRGSASSSSFTGGDYYVNFDLMNPNKALRKSGFGISNDNNATLFLNFYNASTTQSTGFTLSATSMTGGTIYVYGYKKA